MNCLINKKSKQMNILCFINKDKIEIESEKNCVQMKEIKIPKRLITDYFDTNEIEETIDVNQNKRVEIYTDGSSFNNGKKNCRASWAFNIYEDDICIHRDSGKCNMKQQSNQKAELLSIYEAIMKSYCIYNNKIYINKIYIYSDSLYSIKCITDWSNKWTTNDWNNKKNTEIIKKIKDIISQCKFEIIFIHIYSHQNQSHNKHHIRNNIVDKEAKKINNI